MFAEAEDRITRIIVFKPYLLLMSRLIKRPNALVDMVYQMTDTLHALQYDALVLHRDISSMNALWDPEHEGGVHFILNDFDLAVELDSIGTAKASADMAESPQFAHQLDHDYDSLFWLTLWGTIKTEDNIATDLEKRIKDAVAMCETDGYKTMGCHKNTIFTWGIY
ncbi:hypothetical protein BC628DRAFT_1419917 [Trametes gibbosa]|nr:hypothetical protein BC628DRAFT_1419917 [Trametes gibbosa]